MRKVIYFTLLIVYTCVLARPAQKIIEVDFRVFSGSAFVDNLSMADIQLFEDGESREINSLCLVKGNEVVRMEGLKKKPKVSRLFVFIFYIRRYSVRIDEAIDFFFDRVITPKDALIFFTPEKIYNLKGLALSRKPKHEIAGQMKTILRKDTMMGNNSYLERLKQLQEIVSELSEGTLLLGLSSGLSKYTTVLENLERMRFKEQTKIIKFLLQQRKQKGKKFVYLFYEREVKPDFTTRDLQAYKQRYNSDAEMLIKLQEMFELYKRGTVFNLKETGERFAGSGLLINFSNFKNTSIAPLRGVDENEYSEDVLGLFTQLARVTGGMVEHSSNPASFFYKAESFSRQFYTLRYVIPNPGKKKKFKKIIIKLKNKDYKVFHRSGY